PAHVVVRRQSHGPAGVHRYRAVGGRNRRGRNLPARQARFAARPAGDAAQRVVPTEKTKNNTQASRVRRRKTACFLRASPWPPCLRGDLFRSLPSYFVLVDYIRAAVT